MDEPWDELSGPPPMGGSSDGLKEILSRGDDVSEALPGSIPVRRTHSTGGASPSNTFSKMPDRWAQYEQEADKESAAATAQAKSALRDSLVASWQEADKESAAVEVAQSKSALRESLVASAREVLDDDEDNLVTYEKPRPEEGERIRQDALKMLEVADGQLADSAYSVHKTISGGFIAEPKTLGSKKRVPTALKGISFNKSGSSNRRPYHDDPYATEDGPSDPREDYEYGEENPSGSSKNWSSRYSIDHTLFALGGSAMHNKSYLDDMDKQHRSASGNFLTFGPKDPPQVFGSGFSFRKNHVFGKQNTTLPQQTNLNASAAYKDDASDKGAMLPPATPRTKSWAVQLQQSQKKRRRCIIAALALLVIIVIVASVASSKNSGSKSFVPTSPHHVPPPTVEFPNVTFYVTSNVPYTPNAESKLMDNLKKIKDKTDFVIHVGNMQQPYATNCRRENYAQVATFLHRSPVPMFMIPGEHDWVNCPEPETAFDNWSDNFAMFDTNFDHPNLHVFRQEDHLHNFAFEYGGVLFMGINLVNGVVVDWGETQRRGHGTFQWIRNTMAQVDDRIRTVFIFGNAKPGMPHNQEFFDKLASLLDNADIPAAYVYANDGMEPLPTEGSVWKPFPSAPNVLGLEASDGNIDEPLSIRLTEGERPSIYIIEDRAKEE